MFSKFFAKGVNTVGKRLANLSDPLVGANIGTLQRSSLLIRVDGRSLSELSEQGGLLPRIGADDLKNIRHSQVERYQKYNENPFAWGACSSLKDLMVFVEQNKSHTEGAWVHKFYGKATSLMHLKLVTGMEIEGHDCENEEMIVEHVPLDQFLASTCPKYREKFLGGGLVPNAMAEFNPDLPKSIRMSDLYTESDVLAWLLVNNSEESFAKLCQELYATLPEQTLTMRLEGNKRLVDAVGDVLVSENILRL